MTERVLISRETGGDTVNGQPVPHRGDGRVWIDEPSWSRAGTNEIFSSTTDPAQATRFDRDRAEALIRKGLWSHRAPRIEEVDSGS